MKDHPVPLALALANSYELSRGVVRDLIGTPAELVVWLGRLRASEGAATGGMRPTACLRSPPVARIVHREAWALRDAIRDLVVAHAAGARLPGVAVAVLDRAAAASATSYRVTPTDGAPAVHRREVSSDPLALLAPFALSAADLLATADPERLRRCAASGCPRWFLDTSKAGRRRWCSMATCGNRRKAARHRRRHAG